jgi:hypothetical protein
MLNPMMYETCEWVYCGLIHTSIDCKSLSFFLPVPSDVWGMLIWHNFTLPSMWSDVALLFARNKKPKAVTGSIFLHLTSCLKQENWRTHRSSSFQGVRVTGIKCITPTKEKVRKPRLDFAVCFQL